MAWAHAVTTIRRRPSSAVRQRVALGLAGAVFSLEASRLARSCSDWYRLLELCAWTDTLIIDEEGVYDPTQYNDRLLLGFQSGATYPTAIPHSRHPGRYPQGAPS